MGVRCHHPISWWEKAPAHQVKWYNGAFFSLFYRKSILLASTHTLFNYIHITEYFGELFTIDFKFISLKRIKEEICRAVLLCIFYSKRPWGTAPQQRLKMLVVKFGIYVRNWCCEGQVCAYLYFHIMGNCLISGSFTLQDLKNLKLPYIAPCLLSHRDVL